MRRFCRSRGAFLAVLVFAATAVLGHAADWPQFRGAGGAGVSTERGLATKWDAATGIAWKTELPGPGSSSPVTFAGRIYVTCYSGYGVDAREPGEPKNLKRHLLCLEATGKILWHAVQAATNPQEAYEGFIPLHGYASSTPAVDETGVYVFYGATGAAAYAHDGKQLWLTPCGAGTHEFGTGTSPVLFEKLVIVNASVESGALIALDKTTGKEVWRQPGMKMSWNTPALVKTPSGKWELAVSVEGKVVGFDPASGEPLWNCPWIEDYLCPSLIAHDGVVYAIGGSKKSVAVALRAGGRGDVSASHKVWEAKDGSNVSSPVLVDGHLYWAHDKKGAVYCVEAATGKRVYEKRLEPRSGLIYASPVAADGKLYYVSREQGTFVVAAKPEFELVAHNKIETDDGTFNGSPAILGSKMLLRSDRWLYCIGP